MVGVGASAGGLEAFTQLIAGLPVRSGMAFVLVQHLDPTHPSMLTDILGRSTRMPVVEVADGMRIERNRVHVAPPGVHITLKDGAFGVAPRPTSGPRPLPIDLFFESLAQDCGPLAIGVILSGTLSDGARGLKAIKAEGGLTFAQDEKSAKFPAMPRAAVAAGAVDRVVPPEGIARELSWIARRRSADLPWERPPAEAPSDAAPAAGRAGAASDETHLRRAFQLLEKAKGVDFSRYRSTTIRRRFGRRILLTRAESLEQYVELLKERPAEMSALYDDLLITVTGFFRDPDSFAALKELVLPALSKGRRTDDPIRIWVPGCSTGEEAYSVAIVLFEYMGEAGVNRPVQIFATDVSESAIQKARGGVYLENAVADVAPERLRRFFSPIDGAYRISKAIRDACVFARQNVVADPPFSNLDLVSCRNLLIYLEPVLQKRILSLFHYALKPTGFLLLGRSESLGSAAELFRPLDPNRRIFARHDTPRPTEVFERARSRDAGVPGHAPEASRRSDAQREADRLILNRYAPAGVLVNDALEIVQFRGHTSAYLEAPAGAPSLNLLKMAREGLLADLRAAIAKARRSGARVRVEGVRVRGENRVRSVDVEVAPIASDLSAPYYLVVFEEGVPEPTARGKKSAAPKKTPAGERRDDAIVRLEQELTATRESLEAIIQAQEASNEELTSANEEILSSNEELQSTNEELETAKEELQSANEEITTVNEELAVRSQEIAQVNSDLVNLLSSIRTAILMVDIAGRLRRFTPISELLLGISASDLGRPIRDLRLPFDAGGLAEGVSRVIGTAHPIDSEVQTADGLWFTLHVRPYRTLDDRIDGAVLLFQDIDPLKRTIQREVDTRRSVTAELRASEGRYERLFETAQEGIWILDGATGTILDANPFLTKLLGYSRAELVGNRPWELPLYVEPEEARRRFERARNDGYGYESDTAMIARGGRILRIEAISSISGAPPAVVVQCNMRDVTERTRLEDELRHAQKMESIGRLAGGIAHDFNNILNIISAYSALLGKTSDVRKRAQSTDSIEKAVQRGAALVRQLLTFARRDEVRLEPVDVNAVVGELASMVGETFPRSIRVTLELSPDVPRIRADPSQLHQALLNLCVNARDAMPSGGTLCLTTGRSAGDALRARFPEAREDLYACVEVGDDGEGMSEETRARMFEPFFTTKSKEAGSGLGLSVVYGVVNGHAGFVDVQSKPGRGSKFTLYLPGNTEESARPEPKRAEEPAGEGGSETILVVEDEELLLDSTKSVMESAGYRVLPAKDGVEALEVYREHRKEIALVFADVGLPRLGGWEAFLEMRKLDPDVRAVFVSGTLDLPRAAVLRRDGVRDPIRKPYSAAEMLVAIRRALLPRA